MEKLYTFNDMVSLITFARNKGKKEWGNRKFVEEFIKSRLHSKEEIMSAAKLIAIIMGKFNCSRSTAKRNINAMLDAGEVMKIKRGMYMVNKLPE